MSCVFENTIYSMPVYKNTYIKMLMNIVHFSFRLLEL